VRLSLSDLSALQQDLLQAARLHSPLRRARGGYVAHPGAKPFTVRCVRALERQGLIGLHGDGAEASITPTGSKLLLCGTAELESA
jgi:hypothetical protein